MRDATVDELLEQIPKRAAGYVLMVGAVDVTFPDGSQEWKILMRWS
jgi:hypothetical protein